MGEKSSIDGRLRRLIGPSPGSTRVGLQGTDPDRRGCRPGLRVQLMRQLPIPRNAIASGRTIGEIRTCAVRSAPRPASHVRVSKPRTPDSLLHPNRCRLSPDPSLHEGEEQGGRRGSIGASGVSFDGRGCASHHARGGSFQASVIVLVPGSLPADPCRRCVDDDLGEHRFFRVVDKVVTGDHPLRGEY